jgi:hypothetical protein
VEWAVLLDNANLKNRTKALIKISTRESLNFSFGFFSFSRPGKDDFFNHWPIDINSNSN